MDQLLAFERALNGYVWGGPMIALLIGTGVLLTILTGFVQFRRLGTALREVLGHIFTRTQAVGSACLGRRRSLVRIDGSSATYERAWLAIADERVIFDGHV